MLKFLKALAMTVFAGTAALFLIAAPAFAATYSTTPTLDHDGHCKGYGWGNSAYGSGVYAGTDLTFTDGVACYLMQDAWFRYNSGSIYNPASTGWQTYNLFQGAGPEGSCDVETATHWISYTQGGSSSGSTSANDGC
jgi:hypothetical protein